MCVLWICMCRLRDGVFRSPWLLFARFTVFPPMSNLRLLHTVSRQTISPNNFHLVQNRRQKTHSQLSLSTWKSNNQQYQMENGRIGVFCCILCYICLENSKMAKARFNRFSLFAHRNCHQSSSHRFNVCTLEIYCFSFCLNLCETRKRERQIKRVNIRGMHEKKRTTTTETDIYEVESNIRTQHKIGNNWMAATRSA